MVTFFSKKENQRRPIINYIRHFITDKFNCKTNNKILNKAHYPDKRLQFRASSKNSDHVKKLESFINKYKHLNKNTITRITINRQTCEHTWCCLEDMVHKMHSHWQSFNILVEIKQSNYNQDIAKEKENAKISL